MWDNPRLLNLLAGILVGLVTLALLATGAVRLLRSELFPLREILLTSPLQTTSRGEIEAVMREAGTRGRAKRK